MRVNHLHPHADRQKQQPPGETTTIPDNISRSSSRLSGQLPSPSLSSAIRWRVPASPPPSSPSSPSSPPAAAEPADPARTSRPRRTSRTSRTSSSSAVTQSQGEDHFPHAALPSPPLVPISSPLKAYTSLPRSRNAILNQELKAYTGLTGFTSRCRSNLAVIDRDSW